MGTKSSNIISKKEMLPLFQVISDLEKPIPSSTSLQTNFSSTVDNSSICSHKGRCDKLKSDVCSSALSCFLNSDGSYISHIEQIVRECDFADESSKKKRNKKRRRLKNEELTDESEKNMHYRQRRHKTNDESSIDKEIKSRRSKEIILKPDIHSAMVGKSRKLFPNIEKRKLGMFSTMTLDRFNDDELDLSRHFKNVRLDKGERDDCPVYEIPKDVIKSEIKTAKKKRRKHSSRVKDDHDIVDNDSSDKIVPLDKNKYSKRAIIKRYENMLESLMQKCQENEGLISDKDKFLFKMKKRLKQALSCNNQFAEENDYLKHQHDDMKNCIERYKSYTQSLEEQQQITDQRRHSDGVVQSACPRCSVVELSAIKIEKENAKLNEDVVMLKNVVFRLNVQLSRYQDKLRCVNQTLKNVDKTRPYSDEMFNLFREREDGAADDEQTEGDRNRPNDCVSIPSLPNFSNVAGGEKAKGSKLISPRTDETFTVGYEGCTAWGDVNTHTLAPLLNAYQESLMEKDDLIHNYEKEFNRFTVKIKQIIFENNDLHSNTSKLASDLIASRETCILVTRERDDLKRENFDSKERLDDLERKFKSAQENFELKVETMSRDYTLIHQEYFKTKTGLAAAQGRCQAFEDQQKNLQSEALIPSNVHISKIEECKRSFEELKNRYEIDKSKMSTRLSILEENNNMLEKKHVLLNNDKYNLELKLKSNDKIIRKLRNTVAAYRKEASALKTSRDVYKRRAERATSLSRQLAEILDQSAGDERYQHLKAETMTVQKEALKELDALEVRLKEQDLTLNKIKEDKNVETSKLENIIREKEATIEAMKQHIAGERLTRFSGIKTNPAFSSTTFKINKKSDLKPQALINKSSQIQNSNRKTT